MSAAAAIPFHRRPCFMQREATRPLTVRPEISR